jgi:hypothetical protein
MLNTFTPGVNTSFSTELNENFDHFTDKINTYVPVQTPIRATGVGSYTNSIAINETTVIAQLSPSIYRTTNNGDTWTHVATAAASIQSVHVCPANSNYAIFFNASNVAGAIATTDGGATWNAITAPTGINNTSLCVVYSITNTGRVFATGQNGSAIVVKYTDNNGTNWTTVTSPVTDDGIDTYQQFYSPTNDYLIGAADDGGSNSWAFYSTNGGSTWTTDDGGSSGRYRIVCAYVDTDNYILRGNMNNSGSTGFGIGKVGGVSNIAVLTPDNTSNHAGNYIHHFSANNMIISELSYQKAYSTVLKTGTADTYLPVFSGIRMYSRTVSGVSLANVYLSNTSYDTSYIYSGPANYTNYYYGA